MAGLPPGDPQLVSMIVNHLKTQGLFDQFRRDCLADVDTKPAYLNLKQRVDNFVSNHLSNHTWSPQLNKNQLRNNIRQLVLQSGMLEQGVDRIVAQVVDPKVNHIFRPQVEKVVHQFLSPGTSSEELPPHPPPPIPSTENKVDAIVPQQASLSTPTSTAATDAMSILDAITSLSQEANVKTTEKVRKALDGPAEEGEQDMSVDEDGDRKTAEDGAEEAKAASELQQLEARTDDTAPDQMEVEKEIPTEEVKMEEEGTFGEDQAEDKHKAASKTSGKPSEEENSSQAKEKAREKIKEEYSLEDSDLDGLSDITVSSVHTSDLSSFEGESEDEAPLSDSSEEGEHATDGVKSDKREASGDTGDEGKESKPRRKAYVHKPFLYSRYYSDSDDEVTVEERRRSAAKDKEERLLKRQQNRERMEEKRKQKASQSEELDQKKKKSGQPAGLQKPQAKEARKEQKVLEKKMALSRKRKLDLRKESDVTSKKKAESGETSKKPDVKSTPSRSHQQKLVRNLSESSDERHRRMSGSVSEDPSDTKKLPDKNRTHSFILDLELGSLEALRQRSVSKFDRPSRKERKEKERSVPEEPPKLRQKQEKKPEPLLNESQQKDGAPGKASCDEKKPKVKNEKKTVKEADEAPKDVSAKRMRAQSVEVTKAEKDKSRDKDKDKDKMKEKDKVKGEKKAAVSDSKQLLLRPETSVSSEDRPEVGPGADSGKKKEKHSKDILKRSKSHSEERQGDKPKLKAEGKDKDRTKAEQPNKPDSDKSPKRVKPADRGKTTEKSKSKEDAKSLPKTDKKAHSLDVRGASGSSKVEITKVKKKEGSVKEQRRSSEEPGMKTAKKKTEKKEKVLEKKASHEDKVEKSSVVVVAEEAQKTSLLKDNSEPVTASPVTNDDTCDMTAEMPAVPPEADALLTLMDVCTSARLHTAAGVGERAPTEATLQDADMKMKEAALTLLSMDPDSALSPGFMSQEVAPPVGLPQEGGTEQPEPQEDPNAAAQSSPVDTNADKSNDDEKYTIEESEMAATSVHTSPQVDTKSHDLQIHPNEKVAEVAEVASDTQPASTDEDVAEAITESMEENPPCETPAVEHVPSPQVQSEVADTHAKAEEAFAEEEQMDLSESDTEMKTQEEQTGELSAPPTEVTERTELECGTEVTKKASAISISDIQEQEKESDKPEGRGGRKRKRSSQSIAAAIESSNNVDVHVSNENQDVKEPSSEETEQPRVEAEVKSPCRGRSSKVVEEEEPKELEKIERTPSRRGRRSAAKADNLSKDEESGHKSSAASSTEKEQQVAEGSGAKSDRLQESEVSVSSPPAGSSAHQESTETDGPAVKKWRSEETEQSVEEEEGKLNKDTGEEAVEDTNGKVMEDTSEGAVKDASETAVRDTTGESTEDIEEEASKDTYEEVMDTSEKVVKAASEDVIEDTSKEPMIDNNKEAVKYTSEELVKNKIEETMRDTSEEAMKDVSVDPMMDTREEAMVDINKEAGKDTNEEFLEDTSEEAAKDTSEEAVKYTSVKDTNKEAVEDTSVEAINDTSEEAVKDTSVQDISEEEAVKETSEEEAVKETSEEEAGKETSEEEAVNETSEDVMQVQSDEKTHEENASPSVSLSKENEVDEQQGSTPKKLGRRGRPPKAAVLADEPDKKEKTSEAEKEPNEDDEEEVEDGGEKGEDGKATASRATTRLASRLEAERNKPSKPSTRASCQSGKDETTAAGARGTKGQATTTKGPRKREGSPPAGRTRGGQKTEETPSKRGKR
ncbi:biorientation of chromosomes in cell division protein 1-like 1 isoform X2 [Dunckerocampus dactyliophorus]|uniref:biorientation of chromosomes in cell division protein 1-like 1 isoform X2 n=1 Tax=Dunckerocampus dactyliophorus TaxID=161453 RepID=UPI002404C97E|nr:biorientation of chromosomes in cell division protein 1-like 1 isoform X2 [Dunckerocampus dactyliophorus]